MRVTWLSLVCTLTLLWAAESPLRSQPSGSGEYALKSAFLYNFAKFTEWPTGAFLDDHAPLVICTVGHDPFGSTLDNLGGKVIRDRHLAIQHLRTDSQLIGCHMLYVSPDAIEQTPAILRTIRNTPVLTVCDTDDCAEVGFMFNMRMVENRVALDLNLEAVQRTPLRISAQLMKLTRIVKGQP